MKEILTTCAIEAGEELLRRLDHAQAAVIAAYWVCFIGVTEWRLEFVSPQVESKGPLYFYGKVDDLLSSPTKIHLTLDTIVVLGPDYSFYKLLRETLSPKKDLSAVLLNKYLVGNEIADLYIYRYPAQARYNSHQKSFK
ncbi:MAG TPA: hypothetical protein VGP08_07680 [Pyrinomonadaceae bacterium]|nr:hypothetical protein [Pyrinomonadaceae bacterium]